MMPTSPSRLVAVCVLWVPLTWPAAVGRAADPGALGQVEKTPVCVVKVVDANGAPLAGVTVEAFSIEHSRGWTLPATLLRAATSPKDGRLSFKIPVGRSLERVVIVAHKTGLGLDWVNWQTYVRGDFTLTPTGGGVLAGRVVDSAGKPIAGAEVRPTLAIRIRGRTILGRRDYVLRSMPPIDLLVAHTDAKGRFRFTGIPKAARAVFSAVATGKAKTIPGVPDGKRSWFRAGRTDIEITMPDEAKVSGKVVNKRTGRPVAGVRVTARTEPYHEGHLAFEEVATGADGEFTIGGLPAGQFTVINLGPKTGLGDWMLTRSQAKTMTKAGQTTGGVRLELVRGGVLEISVVDANTGAPVAGACAAPFPEASLHVSAESARDGVARIRLMPGKYSCFHVTKHGYRKYWGKGYFKIVRGRTLKVGARLRPLPMLRGVVLDPAGKPVNGAEITLMPSLLEALPYRYAIRTQEKGRFAIFFPAEFRHSIPPQLVARQVVARLGGRNLVAAAKIGRGVKTVEIRLAVGARIAGRVVDPAGKPIAGATVGVTAKGPWTYYYPFAAVTDRKGRYEFQALLPGGSCEVRASADGYGRGKVKADLPEKPKAPVQVEKIVLKPANRSISGVVLGPDGKPAAGVFVFTKGKDQPRMVPLARTDKNGKFKIDKLCEGEVSLSAHSKDSKSRGSIKADAGETDAEIQLVPIDAGRPEAPPAPPPPLARTSEDVPG